MGIVQHIILADFFRKTLQRKLFDFFRCLIMGYKSIIDIIGNMYYPIKEHIVNSDQNEVIGDSVFLYEKLKSNENR